MLLTFFFPKHYLYRTIKYKFFSLSVKFKGVTSSVLNSQIRSHCLQGAERVPSQGGPAGCVYGDRQLDFVIGIPFGVINMLKIILC